MKYWLETLGCPKNQVDSDKLAGTLRAEGYSPAREPQAADLIVVNTCAFIEAARQESIDTVLDLHGARRGDARLVVTGCLAERYGQELADALPEVDLVAGFGVPLTQPAGTPAGGAVPVALSRKPGRSRATTPSFDLLNLPRPASEAPWAYLKVAEGCNRSCGFCAIPSFRGKQRSRELEVLLDEVDALGAQEIVLVAQDLASYASDLGRRGEIVDLVRAVAARVPRTRLLYLYPSELSESLIEVMGETGCHYFDLSLQHVSRPHLRRMRRWGDGPRFLERVANIRRRYPDAAFRSSFIIGYPGETEDDQDQLLRFLEEAELDWAGLFPFSPEEGTHAAGLADQVPPSLVEERLAECSELQDGITARRRQELVGTGARVLVDRPGVGRSHREAPEIDGIIRIPTHLATGTFVDVQITAAFGVDLEGSVAVDPAAGPHPRPELWGAGPAEPASAPSGPR
ncbi:MAG: 30S ribosomal protein S12 methylthiotransferase RimO [Acidimicrobiaceae bacterium]|nr:30S ribosomal protein S12 methylthiotransferase RimO [Acidimicrobiaceae bacterium]